MRRRASIMGGTAKGSMAGWTIIVGVGGVGAA